MECKECHKTYTPVNCPKCGTPLGDGVCPECLGDLPLRCPTCGSTVELRSKRPPAPAAEGYAPPPGALDGEGGYVPYNPVSTKAKIGGWLLVFVVFNLGMLLYRVIALVITVVQGASAPSVAVAGMTQEMMDSITTFSLIGSIAIELLLFILPTVVMLYHVLQRNLKFRSWFTAITVIQIISFVLSVASLVVTMASASMMETMMADPNLQAELAAAGVEESMGAVNSASGLLIGGVIFSAVLTAVYIVFMVYLRKSKRVAETFDERNNPPKK